MPFRHRFNEYQYSSSVQAVYNTAKAFRGIERSTADVRLWFDATAVQHDGLSAKADLLVRTMHDLNTLLQTQSGAVNESLEMAMEELEFQHERILKILEKLRFTEDAASVPQVKGTIKYIFYKTRDT